MNESKPTRDEATAALAEAGMRASQARAADAQLGWVLGVLCLAVLAIAGLMSVAPHVVGPAVLAVYLIAIAVVVVVFARIRAYSRAGLQIFSLTAATFTIWNALGSGLSVATGWWAPAQPSFHFGVSEAITTLPLLVGIWLLSRRRS